MIQYDLGEKWDRVITGRKNRAQKDESWLLCYVGLLFVHVVLDSSTDPEKRSEGPNVGDRSTTTTYQTITTDLINEHHPLYYKVSRSQLNT